MRDVTGRKRDKNKTHPLQKVDTAMPQSQDLVGKIK